MMVSSFGRMLDGPQPTFSTDTFLSLGGYFSKRSLQEGHSGSDNSETHF